MKYFILSVNIGFKYTFLTRVPLHREALLCCSQSLTEALQAFYLLCGTVWMLTLMHFTYGFSNILRHLHIGFHCCNVYSPKAVLLHIVIHIQSCTEKATLLHCGKVGANAVASTNPALDQYTRYPLHTGWPVAMWDTKYHKFKCALESHAVECSMKSSMERYKVSNSCT